MSRITIPKSIKEATATLGELDALVTAKEWHRAAIVWAFTYEGRGGPRTGRNSSQFACRDFAARGIHGLTNRETVAAYRANWAWAIEQGYATDVGPGDRAELPVDLEWPGRTDAAGTKRYTAQEPGPFARTLNRGAVDAVSMVNELAPEVRHQIARAVMSNPKEAREVIKHRDVQHVVTEAQLERTLGPRGTGPPRSDTRDLDMYELLIKARLANKAVRQHLPDFLVDDDLTHEARRTAADAEVTAQFIKDWIKGKTLADEADDFLRSQR